MDELRKPPRFYIAIGASAGGLEALQEFFSAMPVLEGAAYIVVQHLAPDTKSVMVELLAKRTKMDVMLAEDSCQVLDRTIYLIPPGKNLMIGEGRLLLTDQIGHRGSRFPIDLFFRSLAEDCQHKSIAIVLSGTGSDGSRGVAAVKEVGGLVMVQSPEDAKFDGMPYNAIQSQCADVVADITVITERLAAYVSTASFSANTLSIKDTESEQALKEIYRLLELNIDIDFYRYKGQTTQRRIRRRMGINKIEDVSTYLKFLQENPTELQSLSKDMLIGVTRFFRDDSAFDFMEESVIPNLVDGLSDQDTLRIWSAGCSTGEEAISLAILADEYIKKHNRDLDVKVFASDVDPDAISIASQRRFLPNIVEDLGVERFEAYFEKDGDEYVLIPRIRKMIIFAVHNIFSDPPFSNIHLAVCRNVLIYFQSETQQRVLSMLLFSLKMGGVLFLGASESHSSIANCLDVIHEKFRIFRKVNSLPAMVTNVPNSTVSYERRTPSIKKILEGYERENATVYHQLIESILEDYMPPSLLVSQDKQVLHLYGKIDEFTRNPNVGKPSSLVTDMLVESLAVPVSTAMQRSAESKKQTQYSNVPVITNQKNTLACDISVSYYQNSPNGSAYYLIVLNTATQEEKSTENEDKKAEIAPFDIEEMTSQRIKDLDLELKVTKERLNLTVEELETTNEELQSSNEELMASNEELQSTNEELQSLNEELYTINSEYQQKLQEITAINNDFDALINSVDVGIIFLDDQLLVRRFSPAATKHINLLPGDVGRPLHHIAHNLKMPNFLDCIAQVAATGKPFSADIPTQNGGWVMMRVNEVRPVGTEHNPQTKSNVVISITDISEMRSIEGTVHQAFDQLRRSVALRSALSRETLNILILDDDPEDIEIVERNLEAIRDMNITCTGISDIEEMPKELGSNQYDLCILDLNLGALDGFELLESVSEGLLKTAVILNSGILDEEKEKKAAALGIYDSIEKNALSPELLEHVIQFVLQQKSLEQILLSTKVHGAVH